jgi:peptidoglycan/LPS O-acetylase OafA/YrhL
MAVPSDTMAGIASSLFIATAIGSASFGKVLHWFPFRWLGRVSYSLYLIHIPIVMTLSYACGGFLRPDAAIVAIFLSAIAAEIMYRAVEVPSIRLGRWLTPPRPNAPVTASGVPLAMAS